ncbi:hypothetical protein AWR36_010770 [Microbulbifer flavimaris]|uniref:Uncharacterized protein n=1 Tax=Microbulbifer flavimaris TaxID=1781068 RepID=A0ABX4HYM5_9GAMM|nr:MULTISPECIES: hypothetical protein [Microbulbifer]KUJ83015.1 hypothetical protein AVO43_10750 [Microbulbifer sp. ZGT114]PCO05199.1 hypothetical protein AWR36_010770 [Microbulbifer flavimaris]
MLNKSQSISARLSPEDYAYLMSIDRNGAVTQSEKVRELIAMARESAGAGSFALAYLTSTEAMLPVRARYAEGTERSLLVEAVMDLVSEGAAAIQSCANQQDMVPALEKRALPAIDAFLNKLRLLSLAAGTDRPSPDIGQTLREYLQPLDKSSR